MAGGISKEKGNRIVYNALKKLERELKAEGIQCFYKSYNLMGSVGARTFGITYRKLSASNGEAFLFPSMIIHAPMYLIPPLSETMNPAQSEL